MKLTYSTTMTCGSCLNKIAPLLDNDPSIESWEADLNDPRKLLRMQVDAQADPQAIKSLIGSAGFQASLIQEGIQLHGPKDRISPPTERSLAPRFQLATYRPLFWVLVYVIGLATFVQLQQTAWSWHGWMNYFMGFFFLGFAFFKLLDTSKFADAFASYDIVARRSRSYGLLYPWIEVGLGLLFITGTWLVAANLLTLVVMGVGLVGVISAVRQQQTIQCACLGTAFNLPMSVVTIIENSLMMLMALVSLLV